MKDFETLLKEAVSMANGETFRFGFASTFKKPHIELESNDKILILKSVKDDKVRHLIYEGGTKDQQYAHLLCHLLDYTFAHLEEFELKGALKDKLCQE